MPEIRSNLSPIRQKVADYLKNFDFIIDEDGVKFAKEKARELNRIANRLDTLRKEKVKEISAPIAEFDSAAKSICNDIKKARRGLLEQVEKFEAETRRRLRDLLESELESLWEVHGVEKEFRKATFEDLVIVSNLTKGGRLTKRASDRLKDRVLTDRAVQDKINSRLLELDGICLKAGLKAPLARCNIEHFLFTEDDTYKAKLKELISAELSRQRELETRLNARTEAKEIQETEAPENDGKVVASSGVPTSAAAPADYREGGTRYAITVTLELVTRDMPEEKMLSAVKKKFDKAGFQSIKNITIEKEPPKPIARQLQHLSGMKPGSLF